MTHQTYYVPIDDNLERRAYSRFSSIPFNRIPDFSIKEILYRRVTESVSIEKKHIP